jgi:deoxyhypusine synthase
VDGSVGAADLVEKYFLAYNAGRLREACRLFTEKMLRPDSTVGLSLAGALTPAGLGPSCVVPLIKAGYADWIVSTGANLYHDAHFALGMRLHAGTPFVDDRILREEGVVRIYDVLFDYHVLLDTDAFFRKVAEREAKLGLGEVSVLAAAYRYGVPVYTSSPGDSSIGMNVAAMRLLDRGVRIDVSRDVNETAALVYGAKKKGKSAVLILGGGSPKNFTLQTEPQIQEVLGLDEKGHDYFLQVTDARPDTGGLSGATPSEAVSWGKVDPSKLPDTVVCYLDTTVALPLLAAYAFAKGPKRTPRRLYDKREALLAELTKAYRKVLAAGKR